MLKRLTLSEDWLAVNIRSAINNYRETEAVQNKVRGEKLVKGFDSERNAKVLNENPGQKTKNNESR